MNGIFCELESGPAAVGKRLDRWLVEQLLEEGLDVSRSQVQSWLDAGYITVPGKRLKASDLLAEGTVYHVVVPAPEPLSLTADDVPFAVVYEDDEVVVVDKPRGVVVHPAVGHRGGTVVNGLIARGVQLSALGGEMRPGVVHRIDKDTSGLLMLAKTDAAYHSLTKQLREHTVRREYVALVHGAVPHNEGTIDAPVGRDVRNRQRMAVVERGKPAVTHFQVQERFAAYTYLTCQLETGRTHQIRVHMSYIGYPLVGDKLYGHKRTLPIDGQALHAQTLGFVHPRRDELLAFSAAMPDDMMQLLEGLRRCIW